MTTTLFTTRTLAVLACAFSLAACDTAPVKPTAPAPNLQTMLSQASAASGAGNKEQAVTIWRQAAVDFPAEKSPWIGIAQTRYDAGQYGEAILGAQEVLVRDPNDQLANSIIAISGLRLSTRALSDLSRQNRLSGSLRSESQELAKLLRESLGETILVPVPPVRPATSVAERNKAAGKKAAAKAEGATTSADPFSALK